MDNLTAVTEFLLMEFSDIQELLHVGLFLLVYLAVLVGNLLIMMVIILDQHLHLPIYFFLKNLSFLDSCCISVMVPKSIHSSLACSTSISYLGCVAQVYLFFAFASAELDFLTVKSYDCYLDICQPCNKLVVILFFLILGLFAALGQVAKTSSSKNLLITLAYTVLLPFLNPIIYNLRNKEIKTAV
ncbi:Olfactory receptor 14I1 [Heterocephalus glaber]|uniref:Olfactory receptor 14I1 n=1 Tax=Heterocephalus glaber TaxID=10181 RepID=G5B420_HETGA|nr:Olfactory receptor 14I1 [Heterocephalus glaber]